MNEFYAYLYLRIDGTPYYAGKGQGNRAFELSRRVRGPSDKSRVVVMPCRNEREAFATERELIRNWGRKDLGTGCLLNLTDGGEGTSGRIYSIETIQKIRDAATGVIPSEKTRRKISRNNTGRVGHWRGKKFSEVHLQKLKKSRQNMSAETRRKMSESHKGKVVSIDIRKKQSDARTAYWASLSPADKQARFERLRAQSLKIAAAKRAA